MPHKVHDGLEIHLLTVHKSTIKNGSFYLWLCSVA